MSIPILRPEAVTPSWLTAVLAHAGYSARVTDFAAQRVGTGQIGDSVRFTLAFDGGANGAPQTLVGKFPSHADASRATGAALGNYIREVHFYNHLADSARIRVPKSYFAAVDDATSEFVLMMEDLAPAEQGDQMAGITLDQARAAIAEAAKLHGSHWNDPAIEDLWWVSGTRAAPKSPADPERVIQLWQAFCQRYGDRVDGAGRAVGDELCAKFASYAEGYSGPRCLTHNDYRPDNMLFATAAGGAPVAVVDWQSLGWGCGALDVAYLLGGALPRAVRRAQEDDLLAFYRDQLAQNGVTDYSFATLKRDYARHSFQLFLTAFFAAMIVEQTERGDTMFLTMLRGATEQIEDLDALSLL
ncbi:MAG: phosphotransferase [Proteobacteria bacterium]|nr:phosphotransferase [Pseudomonadota bacterium]